MGSCPALLGERVAVALDLVLWTLGTLLGLATAALAPYLVFTRHSPAEDEAGGGWLMPVVPPMVSAATGALLVPHVPAGQVRETLLLSCHAMFGLALVASVVVLTTIWRRLVRHGVGAAVAVPTLWIVLGPLGQSVTAVHLLGAVAPDVLAAPYADALAALALVSGMPVWGFAMLWLAIIAGVTVRAARSRPGLPFSLTWWSFTFPLGTVVTGTAGLADTTGLVVWEAASVGLLALLMMAWTVVTVRTVAGIRPGRLLRNPQAGPTGEPRAPAATIRG